MCSDMLHCVEMVLSLTVDFAVDLGSYVRWGKPTDRPLLMSSNRFIPV